jgi:3-oxoacyl-[acyl-carrier protein] reductase
VTSTAEASLFGLAGKKAVVIGGGQGMGESTSRFLARAGCDVAVIDIERERAERVAGVVTGFGTRGLPIIGATMRRYRRSSPQPSTSSVGWM